MNLRPFPLLGLLLFVCVLGRIATAAAPTGSGPFPPAVAAWSDDEKAKQREAGTQVLAQIRQVVATGAKQLTFPKADYRFNSPKDTHLAVTKAHDLAINFQGSTLWFETEVPGITLSGCTNVRLENVVLDWDPLPFIQGRITSLDLKNSVYHVRLDPGYDRVPHGMQKGVVDPKLAWGSFLFDPATREFKTGQVGSSVGFSWDNLQADGTYPVKFNGYYGVPLAKSGYAVGDLVVLLTRTGRAVRLFGCDDCVLENVTLYSSPFIEFNQGNGNRTLFSHCNILRRPRTNRLIAGNADGFNCANMGQGPVIDSCKIDTIGDDFVNILGFYSRVIWQNSPTELIVTNIATQGNLTTPTTFDFFDRQTMAPLGSRQGTAEHVQWTIEKDKCLADFTHRWHSGDTAKLDYGSTATMHRITLDKPIEIKGDVIMICPAFVGSGAVVKNCEFNGSYSRGIRLQTDHAQIIGNHLTRVGGSAVSLGGQAGFWGEGAEVHEVLIKGNTFEDSCLNGRHDLNRAAILLREEGNDINAFHLLHDVQIIDNTLLRTGGAAITALGTDNLTVTGNRIRHYWDMPPYPASKDGEPEPDLTKNALTVLSGRNVLLRDNEIKDPGAYASSEPVSTVNVTGK